LKEPWIFTEETYTKGKTSYTIYYAAPKPYKYGFITSPTKEGRQIQYDNVVKSLEESEKIYAKQISTAL